MTKTLAVRLQLIAKTSAPEHFVFFFNDTAPTEIYTLSLHDALPISATGPKTFSPTPRLNVPEDDGPRWHRSEEHTSELQSRFDLVCRLLLEKKKLTTLLSFGESLAIITAEHTFN